MEEKSISPVLLVKPGERSTNFCCANYRRYFIETLQPYHHTICLHYNVPMCKLGSTDLKDFIGKIFVQAGFNFKLHENNFVCSKCKCLLTKCYNFLQSALRAQNALADILKDSNEVTVSALRNIDRHKLKLDYTKLTMIKIANISIDEYPIIETENNYISDSESEDSTNFNDSNRSLPKLPAELTTQVIEIIGAVVERKVNTEEIELIDDDAILLEDKLPMHLDDIVKEEKPDPLDAVLAPNVQPDQIENNYISDSESEDSTNFNDSNRSLPKLPAELTTQVIEIIGAVVERKVNTEEIELIDDDAILLEDKLPMHLDDIVKEEKPDSLDAVLAPNVQPDQIENSLTETDQPEILDLQSAEDNVDIIKSKLTQTTPKKKFKLPKRGDEIETTPTENDESKIIDLQSAEDNVDIIESKLTQTNPKTKLKIPKRDDEIDTTPTENDESKSIDLQSDENNVNSTESKINCTAPKKNFDFLKRVRPRINSENSNGIPVKKKKKVDPDYCPSESSDSADSLYDPYDDEGKRNAKPKDDRVFPMTCENCDCEISNRSEHRRHYLIEHATLEYPYRADSRKFTVCEVCGKRVQQLKIHLQKHGEKSVQCRYKRCKKTFYTRARMQVHFKMVHDETVCLLCDFCRKKFKRREDIIRHLRIHTGEKPYKCHICGAGYAHSGNVKIHIRSKHQNFPTASKKTKNKKNITDTDSESSDIPIARYKKKKIQKRKSVKSKVSKTKIQKRKSVKSKVSKTKIQKRKSVKSKVSKTKIQKRKSVKPKVSETRRRKT